MTRYSFLRSFESSLPTSFHFRHSLFQDTLCLLGYFTSPPRYGKSGMEEAKQPKAIKGQEKQEKDENNRRINDR